MDKSKLLKSVFTALVIAVFSVSFFSCSNEKESDLEGNPNDPAVITSDFNVSLSENLYHFFDVTIKYTKPSGNIEQELLTEDVIYNYKIDRPIIADQYVCNIVATPKNPLPEIEPGKIYNLDINVTADVSILKKDGKVLDGMYGENITKQSITAEAMAKYTSKSHTIFNFLFKPQLNNTK